MKKIPYFSDTPTAESVVNTHEVTHDRWIIGEGTDSENEYVVHLAQPRFVAKIDVDDSPEVLAAPHWVLDGGELLYDFVWLDKAPSDETQINAIRHSVSLSFDRNAKKLGF